jgi:ribosomal protein L7/L12
LFNFKKEKVLTHATTWMTLEDIMLGKINQSQKDKFHVILLHEVTRTVKLIKTKRRIVVGWSLREGKIGSYYLMDTWIPF